MTTLKIINIVIFSNITRVLSFHMSTVVCADYGKKCNPNESILCCHNYGICSSIGLNEAKESRFACLPPAKVGGFCRNDVDCLRLDNAICHKVLNQCECLPTYGVLSKKGRCESLIGSNCDYEGMCKVANTVCVDKKCRCKPGYRQGSPKECLLTSIGKKCKKDLDCNDVLHIGCSIHGFCVCKDNHILIDNSTCVPKLGEFCWSDERCAPKDSVCFKNKCQCKHGFEEFGTDVCLKHKLGRQCTCHDDCADVLHAKCSVYGRCICEENYISDGVNFCRPRPDSTDSN